MQTPPEIKNLISELKKSKKYSQVYPPLLQRICLEESIKYKKDKEKIKAVKNRLHEAYGAFQNENNLKRAENFISESNGDLLSLSSLSLNLMKLNTSSNERILFINDLYKFIFNAIFSDSSDSSDSPENTNTTILDIGCGFNPFSLPFIIQAAPEIKIKSYHALDINPALADITNKYFELFNLPKHAGCIDIISEIPVQKADIAFLFKVIPTIESSKKNRGFEVINNLNVKYTAISFPTKTLCGKDIGMANNYSNFFEKKLDYEKFTVIGKNIFENELVYVLKRLFQG